MLRTLRTLMRANAAEMEEGLISAEAPRLLAQHLRDANADLARGRHALATLLARQKAETRRRETALAEIARREEEARTALAHSSADSGALVEELAGRIADLEEEVEQARAGERSLDERITTLRSRLTAAERRIRKLAGDLRSAQAGRLARGVGQRLAPGSVPRKSALAEAESLAAHLGENEQVADDMARALEGDVLDAGDDLDRRLADAGVATAASARRAAVLARLRGDAPAATDAPPAKTTTTTTTVTTTDTRDPKGDD
ncbi:MAG: PspA/IM30 family protein [Pseudomonadota bacterium]